jgi:hypothetical protein
VAIAYDDQEAVVSLAGVGDERQRQEDLAVDRSGGVIEDHERVATRRP